MKAHAFTRSVTVHHGRNRIRPHNLVIFRRPYPKTLGLSTRDRAKTPGARNAAVARPYWRLP